MCAQSTLFNTISKMGIAADNFPFCTIEPNQARVNVPDDRFKWLVDVYKPKVCWPWYPGATPPVMCLAPPPQHTKGSSLCFLLAGH